MSCMYLLWQFFYFKFYFLSIFSILRSQYISFWRWCCHVRRSSYVECSNYDKQKHENHSLSCIHAHSLVARFFFRSFFLFFLFVFRLDNRRAPLDRQASVNKYTLTTNFYFQSRLGINSERKREKEKSTYTHRTHGCSMCAANFVYYFDFYSDSRKSYNEWLASRARLFYYIVFM